MAVYGQFALRVTSDAIDKVGIRHLVMVQKWTTPRSGMSALEIMAARPAAPEAPAWMGLVGIETLPAPGCLETRWTYEGASGSGLKDRTNSVDYAFEPSYQQVDIAQHPNLAALLVKFAGWTNPDGSVQWSQTLAQTAAGKNGLASGSQNGTVANPLFGVKGYFQMEGTYTYRYAEFNLPHDLYSDVGTPRDSAELPGDVPYFKGRNWLKIPPRYRRRGPVFDITESYWLSGPGGWPGPIYTGDNDSTTTGAT